MLRTRRFPVRFECATPVIATYKPLMMTKLSTDYQAGARPQPIWMRLLAMLCLVLVCVASTAQVCHSHSDLAPLQKDSRQNSSTPDHCPLCVAMHSAMPAEEHQAPEPVLQVQPISSATAPMQRVGQWSFDLLSRPPPAASARA